MWAKLETRLSAPTDMTSLVVFRVLFGLLMSVSAVRFMLNGWVERFFGARTFFFKYLGFSWVEPGSVHAMYAVYSVLAVLGLMIAAGAFYRFAIVLFFLLFSYAELCDVTNYLNHYYLVSLLAFLMSFMPLSGKWSLDAWRNPSVARDVLPAWMLYALRFQIGVVYFNAGLAKLGADWLLHGQPLNLWLSAHSDMPIIGPFLLLPQVAILASWGGFLHDVLVVPLLLWARTRRYAYVALLSFHLLTSTWFNIGIFPLLMPLGAMLFFSPSLWGASSRPSAAPWLSSSALRVASRIRLRHSSLVALFAFCALQVLLPLRTHAYGGNVLWHEQGMRFSFRVMLRDKHGSIRYRVRLPDGREIVVPPRRYLTSDQEREMSGQPDLILQLAHHIAQDFEGRGVSPVEVRVDALVSLNGREAVALIDPTRNLVSVTDGLATGDWILPSPTTMPFRLAPRARVAALEP